MSWGLGYMVAHQDPDALEAAYGHGSHLGPLVLTGTVVIWEPGFAGADRQLGTMGNA